MWKRKLLAFIAVGLLLLSGRFYSNGLSRYEAYGEYCVYDTIDEEIEYTGGLVRGYDRLEVDSEEGVEQIICDLSATLIRTESVGGAEISYYYSPNLVKKVWIGSDKISLMVAKRKGKFVIGSPLIKGSY